MRTRTLALVALIAPIAGCGDDGQGLLSPPLPDAGAPAADLSASVDLAPSPPDLSPPPDLTPLPETEFLDGKDGLGGPIIDASPDEAGNLWVVAPDALYIRRPGRDRFLRYTNAEGLHIYTQITAVAGGLADDGYVGLEGFETDYPELDPPEISSQGKAEHVTLLPDDTIRSLHYGNLAVDVDPTYTKTRSARRLLFLHDGPTAGHLFMGGNHGVTHIFNDGWGDHVHVEVYWMPERSGAYGDWYGLALDPLTHGMWTCGKEACGLMQWNASPRAWVNGRYQYAFTVFTGDQSLEVPHGYREDHVGVAVGPDSTAYFLSLHFGLAAWRPPGGPIRAMPVPNLATPVDIAADPDGTLWIADAGKLLRYNPATGATSIHSLPSKDIRRLYMDTRSRPRTLYVSTADGLAIYRGQ